MATASIHDPTAENPQPELPYVEPTPDPSLTEKKPAPEFESWGRYPKYDAKVTPLYWTTDFPLAKKPLTQMLPIGMGRSYGDSCLLEDGTLLAARGLDRLLNFNPETGLLRCEAGVTLAEILNFAVPRGWFLPVTPGTKYVTIAGAIANDIHGKNHHLAGTFGSHVPRFELVRSTGERFECSPRDNPSWYKATIGGLGLTGLITWAELQLRPIVSRKIKYEGIKFVGIDEFVAVSQASLNVEYTVAWIDCVSTGKNFCRGIFMQGDHSEIPDKLEPSPEPKLTLPIDLPEFMLNHYTVGAFNTAYYNKQLGKQKLALMDYEPFFYPLDKVLHWNRGYGKAGLLQFQCVHAMGARSPVRHHRDHESHHAIRPRLVPRRHQGLRRRRLARHDELPCTRHHPRARLSRARRGQLRPLRPPRCHHCRAWRTHVSGKGRAHVCFRTSSSSIRSGRILPATSIPPSAPPSGSA